MSRDFEIRSDDHYSISINRHELSTFLVSLPCVTILEDRYCEYNLPDQSAFMPIYLVLYTKAGEEFHMDNRILHSAGRDRVNAIQLHLSAHTQQPNNAYHACLQLGFKIADYLNWRIYDCDADVYLEPVR